MTAESVAKNTMKSTANLTANSTVKSTAKSTAKLTAKSTAEFTARSTVKATVKSTAGPARRLTAKSITSNRRSSVAYQSAGNLYPTTRSTSSSVKGIGSSGSSLSLLQSNAKGIASSKAPLTSSRRVQPSSTQEIASSIVLHRSTTEEQQISPILAPLATRLAIALQTGNEGAVTENELLSVLPNALVKRFSLGYQLLPFDVSITWLLDANTAFVENPGTLQNILFANKNLKPGDFPNNNPLAAAGTAPGSDTRMAYFGGNPFVTNDGGTYYPWKPVSDPGMKMFDTNIITWLLGLPTGTRGDAVSAGYDIILSGLKDNAENFTRIALSQLFPNARINGGRTGNNVCDFRGSSNPCLDGASLLIVGDNRNPGDDDVATAVVRSYKNGLPLLVMTEDGNYEPDSWKITELLGLTLGQNYFEGQKVIDNSPRSYQAPSSIIRDVFRADVLQVYSSLSIDPLRPSDYAVCIARDGLSTQTIRMGECVESPPSGVAAHALPYFGAIHRLQNIMNSISSNGLDIFRTTNGINTETLRILTLLANKIRVGPRGMSGDTAIAIKYPISTRTDGVAVTRALFADWIVPMSTYSTPRALDLGSLWCPDNVVYEAGNCTAPSFPDFSSFQVVLNSTLGDEWTSTGYTQSPGRAATITLLNDPGIPVAVRTFATRNADGRTAEYSAAGKPLYNRPQFPVSVWIPLRPGISTVINSPYGGPLYISLDGTDLTSSRQASFLFQNVSKHFAVLDASNDNALRQLAQDLTRSPAYWVDIKGSGFELHVPAGKLIQSLAPGGIDIGVGRMVYYNTTTTGLSQLMIDYKTSWAEREYRMAGLKIDGEAMTTSLPLEDQRLCQFLGWDCLNESIHRITETQHLTYDTYAACGQLCSGNPITSSTVPAPIAWGEGHELGHNLQRQQLDIYWPDTSLGKGLGAINVWANYSMRSTEVSNNIFPYFNQWTYFRLTLPARFGTGIDDGPLRRHDVQDFTILFSARQSAYLKLQQNGQNVVLDHTCKVLGTFPIGTRSDVMLADAVWSNNGYAVNNGERMSFYFALPQILQGKTMANNVVLTDGRNIYTLMYQAARLFSAYATDAANWQARATSLGFSRYAYTNDAVYGAGKTVNDMIGNDFLVVVLSLITRYDFRPYFTAHGVFYTSLANTQVSANTPSGGYKALGSPHVVLGNQYPKTNLAVTPEGGPGAYVSRNVGIDITNAATTWPGADNNLDGLPEDLVGFHPRNCPGVTVP
ncbi:uncharacterized protein CC84DRAFT_1259354 [Paraphaeosphaeria sporulosa]|uniref:Peptidase M60 domain-containing protein n=1 Tax=Paraphaeosphaeria sporulosa TaxID=1460663 RepID=A0A177CGT3_9PLEO|nr:uncharacterized protein CC84DRAFT_1259354 [Paraphaeosphaeria sporulosa]OAG06068.1 hypothetical protein CC84DRAFT_1259354 [Paraphaeosphaeria sporulosa]